jgi:hypothetical protein
MINNMLKIRIAAAALATAALATAGCRPGPKEAAGNRPPAITEARIQPDQPSFDSQITLKVSGSDPDGDQVSYRVEWLVNGVSKTFGSSLILSTRGLAVGDRISARIQPTDGLADGEWYLTQEVELWPKVLTLDSLKIEPSPLVSGLEQVRAVPFAAGGVRLEQLRFVCRWTLDGKVLNDSGMSIAVPPLKAGQKVVVEAAPIVGIKKGHPFRMMATVVGAPPVVKSIDYISQDSLRYVYRVEAEDPNSEPLVFSIVTAPPGVAIDAGNGTVTIPLKAMGQEIRVKVANKSGSWVERRLETSP